ncbi:MAG: arginine--tRNA ligase [Amoebophilaceae bacterium]|nr:arginine--tRNA ligase [Amoebophilaceae bacterium]
MQVELKLKAALKEAFLNIYGFLLTEEACKLQLTRKEFRGNFSLAVFPYVQRCKENPCQIAEKVGHWLHSKTDILSSYNVIDGFLNLVMADTIWLKLLNQIIENPTYGVLPTLNQRVVVEFSSPNTNKPQHLGHIRNNFLGSSLAEILKAAGYTVHKVNIINDRGIHICKSMVAYQTLGRGETPQSSGIKGDHLVGKYYVKFDQLYKEQLALLGKHEQDMTTVIPPILQQAQDMLLKWEKGDPAVIDLWQTMNGWVYDGFKVTYAQLGITFDKIYYESDTYLLGKKIIAEGIDKQLFYKRADGAIAVDLSAYGLGEKVLLRSDETAVYITQDLGTADLRYTDYYFDGMIYVVGSEQAYHFKVLFAIMNLLGRPYAKAMHHLSYGMIDLPNGKMKSREGNVVDADHLVAEMIDTVKLYTEEHAHKLDGLTPEALQALHHTLAIGALKFFLLRVAPSKKMLFNPVESIDFQGDTGTFIQYTYARICSLQRKVQLEHPVLLDRYSEPLSGVEQALILQLYRLPMQVEEAAKTYMPSVIANYALELAKIYNTFYATHPMLKEPVVAIRNFRLLLSGAVGVVLKKSMALLTIELPTKM